MVRSTIFGLLNIAAVILLSPLYEGVLRKATAKIQSRQGPPLWQPYYDVIKLLGKEDIESGTVPAMQRWAAYLSLAAILTVAAMLPLGSAPPLARQADTVVLIYLLTLCGISTLLAGLASGSTYALIGMSREMMVMMTLEPLLAVALVIGALRAGSLRLDAVLQGSVYAAHGFPAAGLLMLAVLLFSLQAFVGRIPFDSAEAEQEIIGGPLTEYSGPKLALFKYVQMAKLMVYSALFVALFVPWGTTGLYVLDVVVLLAKILILVLLITVVAAVHPRLRIDQAVSYNLMLFGVALAALICAICGF
jgi:formate hydrogenlyase subunit 4